MLRMSAPIMSGLAIMAHMAIADHAWSSEKPALTSFLPWPFIEKVEPIGSRAGPVATSHSRRDAVAVSLLGSIALVQPVFAISNPWDKGPVEGLKAESTCKPKGTCACNCMPDGFGAPCIERALVAPSAH